MTNVMWSGAVHVDCNSLAVTIHKGQHDPAFARWSGFWPGELITKALGIDLNEFYRRRLHEVFFVKPT